MMKRVVVTGAGGRLGGGIAHRLRREGRLLAGLDVAPGSLVSHVVDLCDATSAPVVADAVKSADAIVHCAALPGPSATPPPRRPETSEVSKFIGLEDEAPVELLLKNVASTARLLEAATRHNKTLRRVVSSSSAFAMGWSHEAALLRPARLPLTESDAPTPLETYGLSKWLGELVAETYARTSEINVVNLRFTNIVKREKFCAELPWAYDPRIPLLMFAYCHEDDVVDAHLRALDYDATDTFFLAAPDTRFAEPTQDLLARHFPDEEKKVPRFVSEGGNARASVLDARQARQRLGWHPRSWAKGSKAALRARKDPELRHFSLDGFRLSDFVLPSDATLAYRVYNRNAKKLCVVGTSFGAVHTDLEYHVDTTLSEYAVVVFNLLGNGVSWSPSTAGSEKPFPTTKAVTIADNVRAQRLAFLADADLAGRPVDLCYGYSMGAMQSLEWARADPQVRAVAAVCGASGCSDYNAVFLEALIHALESSSSNKLRAFAAIYAGWGVGPAFYRGQHWRPDFASLDDFLDRSYGGGFADDDPDDLLAMVRTWRATPRFSPADLTAINARVLLVPCDNDTYFRLDDILAHELAHLPRAEIAPLRSPAGHRAGDPWRPGLEREHAFITASLRDFMNNNEASSS